MDANTRELTAQEIKANLLGLSDVGIGVVLELMEDARRVSTELSMTGRGKAIYNYLSIAIIQLEGIRDHLADYPVVTEDKGEAIPWG